MRCWIATLFVFSTCALLLSSCATVPAGSAETGYAIHGFVGKDSQTPAGGATILLINGETGQALQTQDANFMGKYKFSGLEPGHYQLKVGGIVQDVVIGAENVRRDIDLSAPTGLMNYAEAGMKDLAGQLTAAATGGAAPAGPNDTKLAAEIAGTWWGYSGSTEVKIGLCPDGSYADYTESGYSGSMHDAGGNQTGAWGSASQSGGRGTWAIQGDYQSGTISVRYNDGRTAAMSYRQGSEKGCLVIDGRQLCRTSAQCE